MKKQKITNVAHNSTHGTAQINVGPEIRSQIPHASTTPPPPPPNNDKKK